MDALSRALDGFDRAAEAVFAACKAVGNDAAALKVLHDWQRGQQPMRRSIQVTGERLTAITAEDR